MLNQRIVIKARNDYARSYLTSLIIQSLCDVDFLQQKWQAIRNVSFAVLAVLLEAKFTHRPPSTGVVHPTGNGSFTGSCPVWPSIRGLADHRMNLITK